MKFKLDEKLPAAAGAVLLACGHDARTVFEETLVGQADELVLSVAVAEERVLVTFDLDFADERAYPPGSHAGIVVLRLRSQERDHAVAVLERLLTNDDIDTFARALIVVTESTVRIRRPHT